MEGALSPHSSKHASMTSRSGTGAPLSLSQECTGLEGCGGGWLVSFPGDCLMIYAFSQTRAHHQLSLRLLTCSPSPAQ